MTAITREPLIHFLLIGALIFLTFEMLDDPASQQSSQIIITQGQIDFLKASYTRTRQRTPSEKELQGIINSYIREEILYREALALGLDKGDSVIRGRLRQKMELLSDDLASIAVPTDEELQQYLDDNAHKFSTEPQMAFQQIFIDVDKHGLLAEKMAARVLQQVTFNESDSTPGLLGDRLMQPTSVELAPISEITKLFGNSFTQELEKITPGQWVGPITSGYGLHIVFITDRVAGRVPQLTEIRQAVEWEFTAANQVALKENVYEELKKTYTIVFENEDELESILLPVSAAQAAQEDR